MQAALTKRAQAMCLKAGAACAFSTACLYLLLVYTHVFRRIGIFEGWIFFVHVVLAIMGLVLAALAWGRHRWAVAVVMVVCGYFVLNQLVL